MTEEQPCPQGEGRKGETSLRLLVPQTLLSGIKESIGKTHSEWVCLHPGRTGSLSLSDMPATSRSNFTFQCPQQKWATETLVAKCLNFDSLNYLQELWNKGLTESFSPLSPSDPNLNQKLFKNLPNKSKNSVKSEGVKLSAGHFLAEQEGLHTSPGPALRDEHRFLRTTAQMSLSSKCGEWCPSCKHRQSMDRAGEVAQWQSWHLRGLMF